MDIKLKSRRSLEVTCCQTRVAPAFGRGVRTRPYSSDCEAGSRSLSPFQAAVTVTARPGKRAAAKGTHKVQSTPAEYPV
jgi:hypothetical protein